MLAGFKNFIMRGNVIDLAVAFVMGVAFKAVVDALVEHFITPLIAAVFGQPNLDSVMTFTIHKAEFSIGAILTPTINFVLIAAVVYFVIVMPLNKLAERRKAGIEPEPEPEPAPEDVALLQEIINSSNPRRALREHADEVDEVFMNVLAANIRRADEAHPQRRPEAPWGALGAPEAR